MRVYFAGRFPAFRCSPNLFVLFCTTLMGLPSWAQAGVQVEPGSKAILTVSIDVEGSAEAPQPGNRGEVVRWSTQRHFEATIRMVAEIPEQVSFSALSSGDPAAMPDVYADLAKKAEACGQDQACLMKMAMEMASSPEMKEASEAPAAYQLWKAAPENALVDSKVSYQDKWYSMFVISGPEITDCTLTAPKISPELEQAGAAMRAALEQSNQETVQASIQGFMVETDANTGSTLLGMQQVAAGAGDEACKLTIGGNPETHHRASNGTVIPVGEMKTPLIYKGSAPGTKVISSGSEVIHTKFSLSQLGAGVTVTIVVPIKVSLSWEMKAE